MSDKQIRPALTALQWEIERDPPSFVTGTPPTADQAVARIARLNYYLPDDDPHKITRADVEQLEAAIAIVEGEFGDTSEAAYHCRHLAAKLTALLPPETA